MQIPSRWTTAAALAAAVALTGLGVSPTAAGATAGCVFGTASPGGDRIRAGGTLASGRSITSPSGQFTFGVTSAGELQLTNTASGGRRWLKTSSSGASLVFAPSGVARLTAPNGAVAWTSLPGTACTEIVVQDSGRVAAIDQGKVLWTLPSSASNLRDPAQYPFAVSAPWNTSIGSGASYEGASSTRTKNFLSGTPVVNSSRWSFAVFQARSSDPVATVSNTKDGRTYTLRIPADAAATYGTDKHLGVIDPGGRTAWEFYKMERVDATHWTTTRVTVTDLTGSGFGGSRASNTSIFAGLIRAQELNTGHIDHTLAVGIPNSMLKSGFVWPALAQDTDGSSQYTGTVPMGSLIAIPPTVDLSKLGLTAEGLALGQALQDYGAYVLLRSSSVALYCEASCDATKASGLNDAWRKLYPLMRVIKNNSEAHPGGGGTPRVPPLSALR